MGKTIRNAHDDAGAHFCPLVMHVGVKISYSRGGSIRCACSRSDQAVLRLRCEVVVEYLCGD